MNVPRPFFRDDRVAAGLALALLGSATFLMWDAFGRRGQRTPRPYRVAAGVVSAWW